MEKYYKYKKLEENGFQEFDKSDILSGPLHIAIVVLAVVGAVFTVR